MLTRLLIIAQLVLICLAGAANAQAPTTGATATPKPGDLVTCESIAKFSPRARVDIGCEVVKSWMGADAAGINTMLRIQHFFTQIATETGGMTTLSENLDYSAERIPVIWPSRVDEPNARRLAHRPRELANYVYNGRLGNATGSDDGWTYRGGGLVQLTGRKNYRETGINLGLGNGLEEHPELLRVPSTAFSTAISFWQHSGANAAADRDDVTAVRRAINGGVNGLADAKIWLVQAKKAFAPPAIGAAAPEVAAQATDAVLGKLQELGYVEPSIAMNADKGQLANDGLKRFQAAKGLPQTGVLDEDTLYALTDPANRQRDR